MSTTNNENITSIDDDIHHDGKEPSDFTQAVSLLSGKKHKRRLTILNEYQIPFLTSLDVIAQVYDIPFLKSWVDNYTEYRTSLNGIGRTQIVDIAKFRHDENEKNANRMFELMRGR